MDRIKIIIKIPTTGGREDHQGMRCFYEDLNEALRRASGGIEWVVEGGRTGARRRSNREHVAYQYVCQIQDPTNRTTLIDKLLDKYELGDQARIYEARSSQPGWSEIE